MTNETITHEGVTYRKVARKANVGEKVLITNAMRSYDMYRNGDVLTVDRESIEEGVEVDDIAVEGNSDGFIGKKEYLTLEPIASDTEIHSHSLTLTEADVRNNPRQVIDLITNLAGRQTKSENTIEFLTDKLNIASKMLIDAHDRIDRLASANEQAISTVARNVETWAQETEGLKRKVVDLDTRTQPYQQAHELFVKIAGGMNERKLTAEERREL
jgi:hypothetical protein